jgi:ABC-2 type transport system ATP-binding protein
MKLSITDINKTYPNGVKALDSINLKIEKGMFGMLGPNGAGKSTLMRTIAALQDPDTGSIMLGDIDIIKQKDEFRKVLGYLPQDFGFYPKVTALEQLTHFAILKGVSNKNERKEIVAALLNQTNLFEARNRYISTFSGGMRQRFGIAQALIGNPQLVIVDEPTAGLDPMERNRFHNLLSEIGENVIIILSTHIVDDVKDLCSRMVIMNHGKILLEGTPSKAIDTVKEKIWSKLIEKDQIKDYKKDHTIISTKISEGKVLIHTYADQNPGDNFEQVNPNLEDVYFSLITKN